MEKILVFEMWADFAHFKKIYTTSSPLTYGIPPKTVFNGIIGALMGYKKSEYNKILNEADLKYSISLKNKCVKKRMGFNWIDTKRAGKSMNRIEQRTQVNIEFVKSPHYKFYVNIKDQEIYSSLKNRLENHTSVYTPYFGVAYCISDYCFTGEYNAEIVENIKEDFIEINGSTIFDNLENKKIDIDMNEINEYYLVKEKIPFRMDEDRRVLEYKDMIYEISGKKLKIIPGNYLLLENGEKIILQ